MKILEGCDSESRRPDKARAFIIDENNNVAISDYAGCLMFPGGKLDDGETSLEAVKREVREETGMNIDENDYQKQFTLRTVADEYPARDGTITKNRMQYIDYYSANVPRINFDSTNLTDKEQSAGYMNLAVKSDELMELIIDHKTNNERWPFFKGELLVASNKLLKEVVEVEADNE